MHVSETDRSWSALAAGMNKTHVDLTAMDTYRCNKRASAPQASPHMPHQPLKGRVRNVDSRMVLSTISARKQLKISTVPYYGMNKEINGIKCFIRSLSALYMLYTHMLLLMI